MVKYADSFVMASLLYQAFRIKFLWLLQHFIRADLNSYAANDWEHPPDYICHAGQIR